MSKHIIVTVLGLCLAASGFAQSEKGAPKPKGKAQAQQSPKGKAQQKGQARRPGGAPKGKAQQPPKGKGKAQQSPRGKGPRPLSRQAANNMEKLLKNGSAAAVKKQLDAHINDPRKGFHANAIHPARSGARKGKNTLHFAVGHKNPKQRLAIVKLLIDRGADIDMKDINGKTADFYAHDKGARDVSAFIRKLRAERRAAGGPAVGQGSKGPRSPVAAGKLPKVKPGTAQKGGPHPDGLPPKVVYQLEKLFGGKADPNKSIPVNAAAAVLKRLDNNKDGRLTRKELFHD